MKHVILYAHPYEGSYNHAILETVMAGLKENSNNDVTLIDLNKEGFDPVLNVRDLQAYNTSSVVDEKVKNYQAIISEADHIVVIFPIWFGTMPAILKGFFERVFSKGFAYESVKGLPRPLIKGKTATVISTMGSPVFIYNLMTHNAVDGELIKGIIKFSGIKVNKWFKLGSVPKVSDGKRKKWLKEIGKYFGEIAVK